MKTFESEKRSNYAEKNTFGIALNKKPLKTFPRGEKDKNFSASNVNLTNIDKSTRKRTKHWVTRPNLGELGAPEVKAVLERL